DRVRITEGPIKSDLSSLISGLLTLGMPGAGSWRDGLAAAKAIGAQTVILAYDAVWRRKKEVGRYLIELARAATAEGLTVELEAWDEANGGKGIDDLLAAGQEPRLITGPDVWTELGVEAPQEPDPPAF